MGGAESMTLHDRIETILRGTPDLMRVMAIVRDLGLPDWMVFSGAVYQPVWNSITGRPADHGFNDYDIGYFDSADLGWDAEDAVIHKVVAAMPPHLRNKVEVRNQARVHLWFEGHFGTPYSPLGSSTDALSRFTATAFAVGARLEPDNDLSIFAPFGLGPFRPQTPPDDPASGLGFRIDRC